MSDTELELFDLSTSELRDAALAPSTLRAYNKNLANFLSFTRLSLEQLLQLPPARIDARMAAFLEHSYREKGSYDYACQAVFGLVYRCPSLRPQLGESRLRLRGWRRLVKQRSHPPITWELTVLFATVMAKWGRHAEAVGALLSFHCYLRVGELTRLRYRDVLRPNDVRAGSALVTMALRLAETKTGSEQSVEVHHPQVERVLLHYLGAYPFLASQRIFPFSPSSFRQLLRLVAGVLGLSHIPYTPHSFRHGGATFDFLRRVPVRDIMIRGRWAVVESTARYIQMSRAMLIVQDLPQAVGDMANLLAPEADGVLCLLMDSVPTVRKWRMRVRFDLDDRRRS